MKKLFWIVSIAYAIGAAGAPVPPGIKRQAAFIFEKEGTNTFPIGTCFSVGVPHPTSTNGGYVSYLVTAKHVLVNSNGQHRSNLWVRVNRWKGGPEFLPLLVKDFKPPTYYHSDPTVDVAVVRWSPDEAQFDFPFAPVGMLAERNAVTSGRIAEGDDVFFPGLFANYFGSSNNVPIIRFGRVSILPKEPIEWGKQRCELYLIESTCFGGNSGSPVFVRHTMDRTGSLVVGATDFFIAGLLIGYFNEFQHLKWVNAAAMPVTANNSGISAIVPAHLIRDILFSPELKKARGEK